MNDESLRGLFAALDESRADAVSLTALADWFEEHDDAAGAACMRWVLQTARRPGLSDRQMAGKFFWEREGAHPILDDPRAKVLERLFLALGDNSEKYVAGSFKSYPTASAAYRALIAGWKSVGGLVPA